VAEVHREKRLRGLRRFRGFRFLKAL